MAAFLVFPRANAAAGNRDWGINLEQVTSFDVQGDAKAGMTIEVRLSDGQKVGLTGQAAVDFVDIVTRRFMLNPLRTSP